MSTMITRKKDTGEQGNGGQFGSVSRKDVDVSVPACGKEEDFEARLREKLRASNHAFGEYRRLSVEANEMAIDKLSRIAADRAPASAVAVGISSIPDDEPERSEDSLRGLVWVRRNGSSEDADDHEGWNEMYDQWTDVDRSMIPGMSHAGLVGRQDSGLPLEPLNYSDVEYVIPIRGRDHGMAEPEAWHH